MTRINLTNYTSSFNPTRYATNYTPLFLRRVTPKNLLFKMAPYKQAKVRRDIFNLLERDDRGGLKHNTAMIEELSEELIE